MAQRSLWATLVFLLCSWSAASAQVVPLRNGDRIRITPGCAASSHERGCQAITGRFLGREGDSLKVQGYRDKPYVVAVDSLTRIEMSGGRRRHTLLGLGAGVLGGIGAGALWSNNCKDGSSEDSNCELVYLLTLPGGALLGTIVGTLISSERWRPVVMTSGSGTGLIPATHGLNVGVALQF